MLSLCWCCFNTSYECSLLWYHIPTHVDGCCRWHHEETPHWPFAHWSGRRDDADQTLFLLPLLFYINTRNGPSWQPQHLAPKTSCYKQLCAPHRCASCNLSAKHVGTLEHFVSMQGIQANTNSPTYMYTSQRPRFNPQQNYTYTAACWPPPSCPTVCTVLLRTCFELDMAWWQAAHQAPCCDDSFLPHMTSQLLLNT